MKVYFISGLAADRRVFKNIILPEGYETVHLDWITPLKNESLSSYAGRLANSIETDKNFVLFGLSMGGMIASEIVNQFKNNGKRGPLLTILVSSIPVRRHLPPFFKLAGFLKLYHLIPARALKSASFLKRCFTTNSENNEILLQLVKESDPNFIRWAIRAILLWKNDKIPGPLLHLHGTKDLILPLRFTRPTHIIRGGGHIMIMDRAPELNKLICEALLAVK